MIHIDAKITFDKFEDRDQLEVFESMILTYNLMAKCSGAQLLQYDHVDCGSTIELRFDTDFDTSNWSELASNIEKLEQFANLL